MASLGLLLLGAALLHAAQTLPAALGGGRGLDGSVGGARRQRRDLRLPYDDQMMSYPALLAGGGANDLYYQSEDWRGRGIDQALQRLVERDQRREQEEEQRAAYLAALLRLLSEAESAGLVGPVEVMEEEEEEERGPPGGQTSDAADDQMLVRMDPRLVQSLMQRTRESGPDRDQEALRRMVARILSSVGPSNQVMMSSGRRAKRELSAIAGPVGPAHSRTRRSLDGQSPSNEPPLLRVKRRDEEEEEEDKLRPPGPGLQRVKRIDTMATADVEAGNQWGGRRRRRAVLTFDPQMLMDQILDYMRE